MTSCPTCTTQAGLTPSTTPCCCRKLFYSCFGTHDQREGMGAFLEKHKAVFQPGKEAMA